MRSFARDLGLYPSTLSMILNEKKGLSPSRSLAVAVALRLPEWKISYFCDLVTAAHAKSPLARSEAKKRLGKAKLASPVRVLGREQTKVFASWVDMAILELTYLKNFKPSEPWIAKCLGVKEAVVQDGVARLFSAGLLRIDPVTGHWSDASALVSTTDGIPSESLRRFHRTVLKRAIRKLDNPDLEARVVKSVVFSTSSANLPRAREILNEAIGRIVALADERQAERDQVLCFSAQLFSLLEESQ